MVFSREREGELPDVTTLELPERTRRPRTHGITAITDVGLPTGELSMILDDFAELVDIAKLGIGSAYVTPRLRDKLALYRKHQITPYLGGTLFEKFYYQRKFGDYLAYLQDLEIEWIEISNGTVDIEVDERRELVQRAQEEGFVVLSEVGCKDTDRIMPPSQWIREIRAMLEVGCRYVITEGRESGTAGIYRSSGEVRTGLVSDIIDQIGAEKLIFEAPNSGSQNFFITQIGANVNLGNVSPRDLVRLEAQRVGLRNETFFVGTR